ELKVTLSGAGATGLTAREDASTAKAEEKRNARVTALAPRYRTGDGVPASNLRHEPRSRACRTPRAGPPGRPDPARTHRSGGQALVRPDKRQQGDRAPLHRGGLPDQ